MQFTPNVLIEVVDGQIKITDISNYDTNEENYQKADLRVRTLTVRDYPLGLTSLTKTLTYGDDSESFDRSLFTTIGIVVTLQQIGRGYNFSTDFVRYLNV